MRRYFEYHIEYLKLRASYTRIYFELKGRYKIQRVKMKKRAKRDYFQKTLEQKWAIFFDMCKRLLSLPLLINIKRFLWSFFCKHNLSLAGIRHNLDNNATQVSPDGHNHFDFIVGSMEKCKMVFEGGEKWRIMWNIAECYFVRIKRKRQNICWRTKPL